MKLRLVFLPTDILIYILVAAIGFYIYWTIKHEHLRAPWRQVIKRRVGMSALVVLIAYVIVGLLDSVHFQIALQNQNDQKTYYSVEVKSLLDILVSPLGQQDEESYSAPF